LFGVGPSRKTGDYVEFLEEGADHFVRVVLATELLELTHDACESCLNVCNGALGIVGSLSLKTSVMFYKFLSVELRDPVLRADLPRVGHEAWHAVSSG
jgi:hypothetical protein